MEQTVVVDVVATVVLVIGTWIITAPIRRDVWGWFVGELGENTRDDYDQRFPLHSVLAPMAWLLIVWVCTLSMLYVAGYLSVDADPDALAKYRALLESTDVDFGARRAAFGFSGVTLAITVALALTSLFWCVAAAQGKVPAFRVTVLFWSIVFLAFTLNASNTATVNWTSFTSELGEMLLKRGAQDTTSKLAGAIPLFMFILSSVVPSILLTGATLLLQPMTMGVAATALSAQLKLLKARLRELDQMLYIGALSLVFGTLQLSAGLSVPLVSMPKSADLKVHADLCKTIGPSPAASNVFFANPVQPATAGTLPKGTAREAGAPKVSSGGDSTNKASDNNAADNKGADKKVDGKKGISTKNEPPKNTDESCRELPAQLLKLETADSFRQLVRGVTLCFGLAFSALLAAIYVPSLIVLRNMIEKRQDELASIPALGPVGAAKAKDEALVVDPFSRIGAVVATLSPLLAGLIANALAGN